MKAMDSAGANAIGPPVSEKSFDEYHLYTLDRRTTLRDRETKQVEFIRAASVATKQIYIYDGVRVDANRYNGWNWENFRNDYSYGTESNPKIWVMREFRNSDANHLGMPLPEGRVRFYRRNDDGQIEFTGENTIDHTPRDETVRIYTGNAFDIAGERRRVDYSVDNGRAPRPSHSRSKCATTRKSRWTCGSSSTCIARRIGILRRSRMSIRKPTATRSSFR